MRTALLTCAATLAFATPAAAQHGGHAGHMPGMRMPARPAAKPSPKPRPAAKPVTRKAKPRAAAKPARKSVLPPKPVPKRVRSSSPHVGHTTPARTAPANPHTGYGISSMPDAAGMDQTLPADLHAGHRMNVAPPQPQAGADAHAGHDKGAGSTTEHHGPIGTNLPPGNAPAPAAFPGNAAARYFGSERMAAEARELRREHGGGVFRQLIFNLAEGQFRNSRDGYRWDGEAWIGGDLNRLAIKTEGAGDFGRTVDDAEVQLLYSRALAPYVNLQAGLRYDVRPDPSRTYASIGVEALAPYWFDVEGTLFLSDKGDLFARAEAYYDQRITNWVVLQPRAELNFAAQDAPRQGVGSGLSDIELGLRLRYEIRREFAPYIGVSWDKKLGDTARFARAEGEDTGGFSVVTGVRAWF